MKTEDATQISIISQDRYPYNVLDTFIIAHHTKFHVFTQAYMNLSAIFYIRTVMLLVMSNFK
jgi:hypothetical protein